MNKHSSQYKRHRFPPEIIQHVVWLYHRFNLSTRDIEDLMAERGIAVSYESIRLWCINSALSTPGDFGVGIKVLVILSISTKSLSEFKASNTIFGGQSTKTAKWWTCFYSAEETERQQSISSSACCEQAVMNRDESSQTS
jgi:hypothetical protein